MCINLYLKRTRILMILVVGLSCPIFGCNSYMDWVRATREKLERERYAYITAEDALAPHWFKNSTHQTLSEESLFVRGLGYLTQSPPVLRLLALSFLLYPIVAWLLYRFSLTAKVAQFLTPVVNELPLMYMIPVVGPLGVLLIMFPVSWFVQTVAYLGLYSFTGSNYYVPFQFSFFCVLSLGICTVLALSVSPLLSAIRHDLPIKKSLGILGLVLEIFGVVFTIRDIFTLAF